jgi:Cdc6-like AAA superfamily ATPase
MLINGQYVHIIYLLCSSHTFEDLIETENSKLTITDKYITIYKRYGNVYQFTYEPTEFNITKFQPRIEQQLIIDDIKHYYNKNKKCVIMIDGPTGSGKSMIGKLLAKQIDLKSTDYVPNIYDLNKGKNQGLLCETYNPTSAGDSIDIIYNTVEPTFENPLIIVIDEFDILLDKFHNKTMDLHKHVQHEVYDKKSWNKLFDDISINCYLHLIVILTTNKSKDNFTNICDDDYEDIKYKKYDSSYIRDDRINLFRTCKI